MAMKYILFVLPILLFSCTSEYNLEYPEEARSFIGEWRMVEFAYSPGGPDIYRSPAEEGTILTFNANGLVNSQKFFQCDEASYKVEEETIIFNFACQEELERRVFNFSWEADSLILIPASPMCIEYCAYIFSRVSE